MKRIVIATVVVLALVAVLGLMAYADERNRTGENQVDFVGPDNNYEVTIEKVNEKVPGDITPTLNNKSSELSILEENNTLQSLVRVSLPEAARSAADAVSGRAVKAELEQEDGRVIYSIEVATNNGLFKVIVDANTGNILFYEQDSKENKDDNQDNSRADNDGEDDNEDEGKDDDDKQDKSLKHGRWK